MKLTSFSGGQEIISCYGTRWPITASIRAYHQVLNSVPALWATTSYPVYLIFNLILSSQPCLSPPREFLPSGFPAKIKAFLVYPLRTSWRYSSYLSLLYSIILIINAALQIIKFLIAQRSPPSCYLLSQRSKWSLQHPAQTLSTHACPYLPVRHRVTQTFSISNKIGIPIIS
jgi:hypothetical protein